MLKETDIMYFKIFVTVLGIESIQEVGDSWDR